VEIEVFEFVLPDVLHFSYLGRLDFLINAMLTYYAIQELPESK
jgi:hypothetical protein